MVRLILKGVLAGLVMVGLLATFDALTAGGCHFGHRTGIIGLMTGGILLALGFAMAVTSHWLAGRGRAPVLRRRLLSAAVLCGAAGMTGSFAAAAIWVTARLTPM